MKSLLNYIKEDIFDINKDIRKSVIGEPISITSFISEVDGGIAYIQSKPGVKPLINFRYDASLEIVHDSLFKEFYAEDLIIEPADVKDFKNILFSAKKEINFHNYNEKPIKNIKIRAPRIYLKGGCFENLSAESSEIHIDIPTRNYKDLLNNCNISTNVLKLNISIGGFFDVSKELLQFIDRALDQPNHDFFKELSLFKNSKFDKKINTIFFNNMRLEPSKAVSKWFHIVFIKKPAAVDYDINKDWGIKVTSVGGTKKINIKKLINNYSNILE